jgi:hypothetical protein
VPDLYPAGSSIFPGPGVEAVVISGAPAANEIYKKKIYQYSMLNKNFFGKVNEKNGQGWGIYPTLVHFFSTSFSPG